MISYFRLFPCAVISILFVSCADKEPFTQFTRLSPTKTGISFVNKNTESEVDNIMTFEYFYNGGGVAAGDINNDGLTDLYFSSNQQENKLYLNTGNLEFKDITQSAGVAAIGGWKTGVSMADINNDGWLDIYVCKSKERKPTARRNLLYINNHDGTFSERAHQFGLDDDSYSTQAAFFDFDNDGDLDVFLLNHSLLQISNAYKINQAKSKERSKPIPYVTNKLLININGKFVDGSDQVGLTSSPSNFGLGIGLSDLNNDGWTDIYTSCDYTGSDKLWINNKGLSLLDATDSLLSHISLFSMGLDIADINQDGFSDILTLDMLPPDNARQKQLFVPDRYETFQDMVKQGLHYQYMRNMLHLNLGNGDFSEIGQLSGLSATDWSWAPLIADYDNDGLQDVFISNSFKRDFTNNDFLKYRADQQLKNRGKKDPSFYKTLIENMPTHQFQNFIFKGKGDFSFTDTSPAWGFEETSTSNGTSYADLDNDGDLDLITNNLDKPVAIYRNNAEKMTVNHFVKIRLEGTLSNRFGIGTSATLYQNGNMKTRELFPVRGFISSTDPILHFGLGLSTQVDSVVIKWPSGIRQVLKTPDTDRLLSIKEESGQSYFLKSEPTQIFKELDSNITFRHQENEFIDFKIQPLLPRAYSTQGPALAVGDINKDGQNDIYLGGAKGQAGELWVNVSGNKYKKLTISDFIKDAGSEDVDAIFFDANMDKHPDLYVVSGGYEFEQKDKALQDRLYINNGQGIFKKRPDALPENLVSGSCIKPTDFDGDGDMDLFIGGRIIPGQYPQNPKSSILINDGKGKFSMANDKITTNLGMVTDAVWLNLNNDNHPDLVVVGEWTSVQFLVQEKGSLVDRSDIFLKDKLNGWWNCITQADIDHDNDLDLIIGNAGLNSQMKPTPEEPVTLLFNDFDDNGSIDPILSYYIHHKSYPYAGLDELASQLPPIRKKYNSYSAYAEATHSTLFTAEQRNKSGLLTATTFESLILMNDGQTFSVKKLPPEAQFSPIFSIVSADVDDDGNLDLITAGNLSATRVRSGKLSGNSGFIFKGDGKGNFSFLSPLQSGLRLGTADVRKIHIEDKQLFAAVNNGTIKTFVKTSLKNP